MKTLTELDLQTALDECAEIKFRSHGEWLAGMVRRLNKVLGNIEEKKLIKGIPKLTKRIIIQSGNTIEPSVPCIS